MIDFNTDLVLDARKAKKDFGVRCFVTRVSASPPEEIICIGGSIGLLAASIEQRTLQLGQWNVTDSSVSFMGKNGKTLTFRTFDTLEDALEKYGVLYEADGDRSYSRYKQANYFREIWIGQTCISAKPRPEDTLEEFVLRETAGKVPPGKHEARVGTRSVPVVGKTTILAGWGYNNVQLTDVTVSELTHESIAAALIDLGRMPKKDEFWISYVQGGRLVGGWVMSKFDAVSVRYLPSGLTEAQKQKVRTAWGNA